MTENDLTGNDLKENDLTEILKVYMLVCPTCSQWCEPYSELACIVSTLSMGFQLATPGNSGFEFARDLHGNKGYGVSSPGIQNQKYFRLKINTLKGNY